MMIGGTVATHANDVQPYCRPIAVQKRQDLRMLNTNDGKKKRTENHQRLHEEKRHQQPIDDGVPQTLHGGK